MFFKCHGFDFIIFSPPCLFLFSLIILGCYDEKGNAISITSKNWEIVKNPPVRFKPSQFNLPLPIPIEGGEISDLQEIVNLNDQQLTLVVGWLLGTLNPHPPYPLLIITGEQGSGKSSLARILKQLIDPAKGELRSQPKDERNLMVAAMNVWVLPFDNLSKLSQSLSDGLCRLSTGNSYVTRKLYSDNEQTVIEAARPVIITSILDTVTNNDLLDRSIHIHLEPISRQHRRSEKELDARFKELKPKILGLLCTAVSYALANSERVSLDETPRMADFAKWVTAAEPALGFETGTFIKAYQANRQQSQRLTIEDSPLALGIQSLLEKESSWEGTATRLLRLIKEYAVTFRIKWRKIFRIIWRNTN